MADNVFKDAEGVLFDCDGVLYVGGQMIDGADRALKHARERGLPCRFTTNTTTRSLKSLHEKLVGLGLPIEAGEVFGVIRAAQSYLEQQADPVCYLLLSDDPREDFSQFRQSDEKPTHIVVGDVGKEWDYALMQRCFDMVMDGAKLVALHKGKYWQTEVGLRMDIGAFVAGLEFVTDTTATVIGKPSPDFFRLALNDMGLEASQVVMVGDDLTNDIGGAQRVGMKGVLVRTGKFRQELVDRSDISPDMIIDSIADIEHLLP
ncbi:TIGR01458 family HAD-type hydrolase [candidate division GN15 bacterium]|nr:TIGR01458 family HAD-type hydrolase [candidate division GN15 bacterium]